MGSALGSGPSSPAASPVPDLEGPSVLDTGSSTKDGFYFLRKDSERRATLVKVLNEDQENVSRREGVGAQKGGGEEEWW